MRLYETGAWEHCSFRGSGLLKLKRSFFAVCLLRWLYQNALHKIKSEQIEGAWPICKKLDSSVSLSGAHIFLKYFFAQCRFRATV